MRALPDGRIPSVYAAEYLGIEDSTLRSWRSEGRGPKFVKVGGRVFYRPSEIDEWLAARTVQNTEQGRQLKITTPHMRIPKLQIRLVPDGSSYRVERHFN